MTLANLPAPNFTGADLSARVNAGLLELRAARRFATVAALLADASLAYGAGSRAVAAGDILEAGGHRYAVAASGATDHHVTTAGSVKLTVLPGERGLSARAFGARGDGATNDTAPLLAWMAAAAGGGALYLPAGTYVFRRGTGPLQPDTILASNVTVCGNGAASVIAGLYMRRTSVYLNGCARTRASKSQFLNHMFAV